MVSFLRLAWRSEKIFKIFFINNAKNVVLLKWVIMKWNIDGARVNYVIRRFPSKCLVKHRTLFWNKLKIRMGREIDFLFFVYYNYVLGSTTWFRHKTPLTLPYFQFISKVRGISVLNRHSLGNHPKGHSFDRITLNEASCQTADLKKY